MAQAGNVGIHLDSDDTCMLFCEDQARYLVASNFDQAETLAVAAAHAKIVVKNIGKFSGNFIRFGKSEASLSELASLYQTRFEDLFD